MRCAADADAVFGSLVPVAEHIRLFGRESRKIGDDKEAVEIYCTGFCYRIRIFLRYGIFYATGFLL